MMAIVRTLNRPIASGERRLAARIFVAFALTSAVGLLVWLGVEGARTRDELQRSAQRSIRVQELRGTIAYLDEWLTMSAQLAAISGEQRWIDRYETARPKLESAITEALALATPEVKAALQRTIDESDHDLETMITAAFANAASGDRAGARALLDGPEFSYLQSVYASGIEAFGQDLAVLAEARTTRLNNRAWVEGAALVVSVVLLFAAVFAAQGHARLKRALAVTETVARTDALTGLPNRRSFFEVLGARLSRIDPAGAASAVILLDLDRFKAVNDAHGHPAGDTLLQVVAARLRAALPGDVVARLGGDEFALVARLEAVSDPELASKAATAIADRIINALSRPFELPCGIVVQVGASVGVAIAWPDHNAETPDEVMQRADIALYRAKAHGRGCFQVFEPGMDEQVRARVALEAELRVAIANGSIVPFFQPLVDMGSRRLIGFEMLARWPHPVRGFISPAEFIPIAEDIGLIGQMTAELIQRACTVAASWPPELSVACNVSPLQLRDRSVPAMVQAALHEAGFPASRLVLEITESALVGDLDLARDVLWELKALGIRLALDDFGTGYSSLRHLQTLPFDKLKIDAGFVAAMATDDESRKIVTAVIGLSHSLGMPAVAEGVETEETAQLLRELGCDVGQGWLFGRPQPADSVANLFLQHDAAELLYA